MSGRIVVEALWLVTGWAVRDRVAAASRRDRRCQTDPVRDWLVGGALIEQDDGVLLVRNRRRDGSHDWTPPGGVIDEGEELLAGLAREVTEETGLSCTSGPGRSTRSPSRRPARLAARVEVWRAVSVEGTIALDDPDGIVVDARYVAPADCAGHLLGVHPVGARAAGRLAGASGGRTAGPTATRVEGTDRATMVVTRT